MNDQLRIYEHTYRVSLMKKENGKLKISNFDYLICLKEYIKVIDDLKKNPNEVVYPYPIFFALDDREGYRGIAADPNFFKPEGYKFFKPEIAESKPPRIFKDSTSDLESLTFINFKELQIVK